jgi:hypothetical protein
MTEPNDRLEKDLANMRPRALDSELVGRIESAIARGDARPWADRLLICAIAAGSLAACVIAGMLAMTSQVSLPKIRPTQTTAQVPTIGAYTQALARADNNWIDAAN